MCGQNTEDILYDENFHRAGLKLKCINGKTVGVNNPSYLLPLFPSQLFVNFSPEVADCY